MAFANLIVTLEGVGSVLGPRAYLMASYKGPCVIGHTVDVEGIQITLEKVMHKLTPGGDVSQSIVWGVVANKDMVKLCACEGWTKIDAAKK
ncbi:MAG: hypothetical protein JWM39_724 [Parcubacteria group bacterium]|jgi:hypothetical protein|nr:hypothetical protein [Parcubacteria group bacterium]